MNIGRWIAGAGALTAGLAVAPGVASAHTADASASCDGLWVSVNTSSEGVTTVTYDGKSETFSGADTRTYSWDASEEHNWSVSFDGPGDEDHQFGGTQKACVEVTTTTAPATTTTQPAATTTTTTPVADATTTTTTLGAAAPSVASSGGATPTAARVPTVGASSSTRTLPATGPVSAPIVAAAMVATLAGAALWFAARRRSAG